MNWQTAGLLLLVFLGAGIVHLRTLARRRRVFLILWALVALLVYRWANFRGAWTEVGFAVAAAAILLAIWWVIYGRRLPTPTDENIRVWSEEDPFE